ncbi:MAG: ATP-dependent Clp protease ATP-binding subunit [Candidatus Nomurabacteria bacterium]|nr:MAG: ATP-dependent Clp protease ATP-binding subunit [Candidatus Nomurabacteria bacterium]
MPSSDSFSNPAPASPKGQRPAPYSEMFGSRILYWDKTFGRSEVSGEKFARGLRAFINGFLVFFGLAGFLIGFWELYQLLQGGASLLDLWDLRSPAMLIFWISLATDCYAYFRIERELKPRKKITRQTPAEMETVLSLEQISEADFADKVEDLPALLDNELEHMLQQAWDIANHLNHREIWPSHILAAMLTTRTAAVLFARLNIQYEQLKQRIGKLFTGMPQDWPGEPHLSTSTKKLLCAAYREAYATKRQQVGVLEVLVALATSETHTQDILYDLEVDENKLRHVVAWAHIEEDLCEQYKRFRKRAAWRPKRGMNRAMTAQETRMLNQYSHDLTDLAQRGAVPMTVGREEVLDEMFRVLERGGSPMLVGNPGVGKTAIVDGIARRMVTEEVPDVLKDKRLVSLSVAALVGNAGSTGELEGRLNQILSEVVKSGNIILLIDNIQNIVGISSAGGESFDLSDVLSQALETGRVQVIGTTNPIDYTRYIENQSSLTSTFTKVDCQEVDTDGAVRILMVKAGPLEYKHHIFFTYDALEKTVVLSQRYMHDRYLPEKAISLLEEVAVDAHKHKGKNSFVDGEDVAKIVSSKTHVAVTKVNESESEKLLNLESTMHQRIIGQDEAVKAVAAALRRARAELRDQKRPIATFLFLGPTGVGKTELAKTLAEAYFGSEDAMIRLDMSEYQEPSSISRLIGSNQGTQGPVGGYLTEAVRKSPFSLVLLDELEKAHPDVLNIFLQVFDDGRLTDGIGRTIDFTNTIIISTSNAGSDLIQKRIQEKATIEGITQELINSVLNQYYRPEFLNRFDKITVFRPLQKDEIVQIVRLLLAKVQRQLEGRGITFEATEAAVQELAEIGFDPVFGARPLRRVIQERVDNALADYLLKGQLGRRDKAILEVGGVIRVEQAPEL